MQWTIAETARIHLISAVIDMTPENSKAFQLFLWFIISWPMAIRTSNLFLEHLSKEKCQVEESNILHIFNGNEWCPWFCPLCSIVQTIIIVAIGSRWHKVEAWWENWLKCFTTSRNHKISKLVYYAIQCTTSCQILLRLKWFIVPISTKTEIFMRSSLLKLACFIHRSVYV